MKNSDKTVFIQSLKDIWALNQPEDLRIDDADVFNSSSIEEPSIAVFVTFSSPVLNDSRMSDGESQSEASRADFKLCFTLRPPSDAVEYVPGEADHEQGVLIGSGDVFSTIAEIEKAFPGISDWVTRKARGHWSYLRSEMFAECAKSWETRDFEFVSDTDEHGKPYVSLYIDGGHEDMELPRFTFRLDHDDIVVESPRWIDFSCMVEKLPGLRERVVKELSGEALGAL